MWHFTLLGDKNFCSALKSLLKLRFSDHNSGLSEGRTPALEMKGEGLAGIDKLELKGEIASTEGCATQKDARLFNVDTFPVPWSSAVIYPCSSAAVSTVLEAKRGLR